MVSINKIKINKKNSAQTKNLTNVFMPCYQMKTLFLKLECFIISINNQK